MTKTDYIVAALFVCLAIAGFVIGKWLGGLLAGIGLTCLVFTTIGKVVYLKAEKNHARRMKGFLRAAELLQDDAARD